MWSVPYSLGWYTPYTSSLKANKHMISGVNFQRGAPEKCRSLRSTQYHLATPFRFRCVLGLARCCQPVVPLLW